jgi:hypothetical protein
MIRLVCIVEVQDVDTIDAAQFVLDRFRETAQSHEQGITIYRASHQDADNAYFSTDDRED